ncbi:MAG: hypothetical protein HYU99_00135 [Deltaproteobacteria bacterium]|nr:hypothetical protein [Deltaproteobacteria bacterium]
MENICFHYLYRDASNFKRWGCIVFSNPKGLTPAPVSNQIKEMIPDDLFIADQVRLPELFIYNTEPLNPDDHCFHEFSKTEATDEKVNDPFHRTIGDFIDEITRAQKEGWQVFVPWERCYEHYLAG